MDSLMRVKLAVSRDEVTSFDLSKAAKVFESGKSTHGLAGQRQSCLLNRIIKEVHASEAELPADLSAGVDDLALPEDEVASPGSESDPVSDSEDEALGEDEASDSEGLGALGDLA